jgi:hypothetical protein
MEEAAGYCHQFGLPSKEYSARKPKKEKETKRHGREG